MRTITEIQILSIIKQGEEFYGRQRREYPGLFDKKERKFCEISEIVYRDIYNEIRDLIDNKENEKLDLYSGCDPLIIKNKRKNYALKKSKTKTK